MGKVTRRPQAAKFPSKKRNRSIIAPSSAPVRALGHLSLSLLAFGHFPLTGGTGLPLKGKAFGRPQGPPLRRIQKPSVFNVGAGHWPARRCTRRVQEAAPYTPAPAATCSARPGAVVEAQQRQFLNSQGPVARREFRPAPQILRAGYVLPRLSGNSRNGGPGVSGPMGLGGAEAAP